MTTSAWNYVDAFERDRAPLGMRAEVLALQTELELVRAALAARQRATPYARPTLDEIKLRAFDQARAARGMAHGYAAMNNARKAEMWCAIAEDFERAADTLTA